MPKIKSIGYVPENADVRFIAHGYGNLGMIILKPKRAEYLPATAYVCVNRANPMEQQPNTERDFDVDVPIKVDPPIKVLTRPCSHLIDIELEIDRLVSELEEIRKWARTEFPKVQVHSK